MRHTKVAHGRLTRILTVRAGVWYSAQPCHELKQIRKYLQNPSRISVINGLSAWLFYEREKDHPITGAQWAPAHDD